MVENTAWSWCFPKAWHRHYCKWVINISSFLKLVVISFSRQWLITSLSHSPGSFSCHQLVLFSSLPPRMMDFWYRAARQAGFATAAHLGFPAQYGFPSVSIPRWDKKQMAGQTQSSVLFSFSIHLISPQAVTSSSVASPSKHTNTHFSLTFLLSFNCSCCGELHRWVEKRGHVSE